VGITGTGALYGRRRVALLALRDRGPRRGQARRIRRPGRLGKVIEGLAIMSKA
jgi:hypothetical protein